MEAPADSAFTRGVGVYPGDPAEDASPTLRIDATTHRNLALRRAAFHSSSYDYNLTAQLITDGIIDTRLPRWIGVSTSLGEVLPKHQREWLVDGNWVTTIDLNGSHVWIELELGGGETPLAIDRFDVEAQMVGKSPGQPENWTCTVSGSDDGQTWMELGHASGMARPGGDVNASVPLTATSRARRYRIAFDNPRAARWQIRELQAFNSSSPLRIGGPHDFTSAWMSADAVEEWVSVDLGAVCEIDRIVVHWIRRATDATVQMSDDAKGWRDVQKLAQASQSPDDLKLPTPVRGRYVRVLMSGGAASQRYVLSELEVHGRGGLVPEPQPAHEATRDGRLDLSRGSWKLQRASVVRPDGPGLSTPGYADADWVPATVPGTVLSSYVNVGAIADPNYADNQLMISDSFFHSDFWYRNEFVAPARANGRRAWLNFDGINWNADVFLNGEPLGRIEGGFIRARFDVTERLRAGQRNALAVRIEKVANPGSVKEKRFDAVDKNGGALGADSPTYVASIGWDWIPTIRGRNTGIWNDVYLSASGDVTLGDPLVTTTLPLPDVSRADVRVQTTLQNHSTSAVVGVLRGRFGDVAFEQPVTVEASSTTTVSFDPGSHPQLRLTNPRLWWPAGYGEPALYDVELRFEIAGTPSDTKRFTSGVRQFAYSVDTDTLRMWINGRRFIPKGGNWGFGESMLRYRGREYDAAMRYHRDMHFNMVRNWVGQIGEDEFYEAADRHGIVVWQDFWLANPWDGPDPSSDRVFMQNALDLVLRIRNHASVGLYCGRNEGYPPKPLDDALRGLVTEEHPDLFYISSSADDVVSGHGPYRAMGPSHYFSQRATPRMHSEMGMPNVVTMDSLRMMMPEPSMWPLGRMWGLHDFTQEGAQHARGYLARLDQSYGRPDTVEELIEFAQFMGYEGYRAMFEAQSRRRMGLLIWCSHPAWPSMVWQTYDYYLEPTAAYFGSKKASEPLHIQWNPVSDRVEVVNYSAGMQRDLTARVQVVNADGTIAWEKSAALESAEDSTVSPITMEYPSGVSGVHFLRLTLTREAETISTNAYWRGVKDGDYRELRNLGKANLEARTTVARRADEWTLTTTLRNPSKVPALMVRLKAVREKTGDRILPALYSDNYIALMPGETRAIVTEVRRADTRGERPRIVVEGFNVSKLVY